jgi:DNA-binding transcriptional ArsR family regulator
VKEASESQNKQQTQSDGGLQKLQDTLEDIKAILLLTRTTEIEEAKKKLLKEDSEEKIYDLCDGKSTEELVAITGKTAGNVRAALSTLRQKGLIRTVERDGNKVHEQRF